MIWKSGTAALMAALLAASPVMAAAGSRLADERAAVTRLAEMQRREEAAGRSLPRLTDPTAGPLLQAAFDERAVLEMDPDDGFNGVDVCTGPLSLASGYLYEGMHEKADGDVNALTPAQTTRLNANSVRYQDEIVRGLRFTVTCLAYLLPGISRFWDALPEAERTESRRAGLVTARDGVSLLFGGVLENAAQTWISPANRSLLLETIVRNGPALIGIMSPQGRARMRVTVDRLLPRISGPDHEQALALRRMLDETPCLGLCAA